MMFFRPKFCANCGSKIERAEWHIWTSRRFCEVCAIANKGHELLPKAAFGALIGVTAIAFGFAFSSAPRQGDLTALKSEPRKSVVADLRSNASSPVAQVVAAPVNQIQPEIRNSASTIGQQKPAEPRPKVVVEESTAFCGAETKKGTPCSRRVKGAARCYQHQGMPAMTIAETQEKTGQR